MRALIVDDEPLARRRLRRMLANHVDIEVVGESANAGAATRAIRDLQPEIVFLDVEMPGATGFEVLSELEQEPLPVVVFVTAFSEYAVDAFDAEAADYLLKPFDAERLDRALDRIRKRVRAGRVPMLPTELEGLLSALQDSKPYLNRVAVKSRTRTVLVPLSEVDWIQADGNYALLHQGKKKHMVRSTLSGLEQRLDPENFMRVHRSAIVQTSRIKELRTLSTGAHAAVLLDGTEIPVSQRYWERIIGSF